MKKFLIGLVAVIIIAGGVYAATHRSTSTNTAITETSTSTDSASTSSTSHTETVPDSGTVTLALGQSVLFHGIRITPTKVVEDSRCPAGVYCIQAGTVSLEVSAQTPIGTLTRTVKLGDSMTLGSQKFTFSRVDPLKTSQPIDPKDYRFTVTVEKI